MRKAIKQPLFLIGFSILFLFLVSSFTYSFIWDDEIRQEFFVRSAEGKIIDDAPYGPTGSFLLGTDNEGFDLLGKIIVGAKYTILGAFAVAFLRMIISIPIGLLLGTVFRKQKRFVNGFADSFHFVPLSIIAYYILSPILNMTPDGFENTLFERIGIEIVILALLTVPIISTLIGNETMLIYQKEYVQCAKTVGASKVRIVRKHIYPALREKLFVLFGQQIMQAFIIFSHLGVVNLFLGGTILTFGFGPQDPPLSVTNEWSGLIGSSFRWMETAPWIPLAPIICFGLAILAVALMIEGYVIATSGRSHYFAKIKKVTNIDSSKVDSNVNATELERLKKTS
ncbi:ABC transporter permease subunit [Bacillus spongiae]|uniref:ABC transporter permease subunit n=1 Tax=Bacillus spongiae TaxID=2683610 RepID=A0ABU8HGI5_9BACI